MNTITHAAMGVMAAVALVSCLAQETTAGNRSGWRNTFDVAKSNLGPYDGNQHFPLKPGMVWVYKGGSERLTIRVLPETRVVDGVTTQVLEEREEEDGRLTEISRNFFATDRATGDVYYFGEEVDIYRDGKLVGHTGAWLSGREGARFGLMVPASPKVGDRFYQEIAPGQALDRVEVVATDERLETPAGIFENCAHFRETTPLDRGVSHKWYAKGVGLVKDDACVLIAGPWVRDGEKK